MKPFLGVVFALVLGRQGAVMSLGRCAFAALLYAVHWSALGQASGWPVKPVPYRGFRTLADLVAAAQAKPGSINFGSAAAVGSSKRASILPELPTTIEAGFPDSDYNFWVGLFAPARTNAALIERVYRATTAALQSPEVRERLPKLGAEPMAMTPGEFDALVREELRTNAVLVKAAGIRPN